MNTRLSRSRALPFSPCAFMAAHLLRLKSAASSLPRALGGESGRTARMDGWSEREALYESEQARAPSAAPHYRDDESLVLARRGSKPNRMRQLAAGARTNPGINSAAWPRCDSPVSRLSASLSAASRGVSRWRRLLSGLRAASLLQPPGGASRAAPLWHRAPSKASRPAESAPPPPLPQQPPSFAGEGVHY